MGLEVRSFAVEVFCPSMLMHGQVASHRRLTDLLNEPDLYIGLTEVSSYPYTADTVLGLERHHRGIVNKSSIVMLAELGSTATAPTPEAAQMRIPKTPHRILVYTNQFAINADIHLTESVDLAGFLAVAHGKFVPLTNATVLPMQTGTQLTSFRRPFLLINREQISYLGGADDQTPVVDEGHTDTIG